MLNKTLLIFCFVWVGCFAVFAQPKNLQRADSLFAMRQYEPAQKLYTNQLTQNNGSPVPLSVYYKLAFISEQQNQYARAMYYLSLAYNRQPNQSVLNKLSDMANTYGLIGYDSDDFSFVFLFFRRYSAYLTLFLLLVAIYVFSVLVYKSFKKQPIFTRHKWAVALYLASLLGLLNLPDSYQIAIINRDRTYLRGAPSSAAPVAEAINKGNKVTIIGQNDEWLHIWWKNNLLYLRKMDVWIVR